MDLLNLFKTYLFSQEDKSSKVTVKNYLSDINHFIHWYENTFTKSFNPKEISSLTLNDYRASCSQAFSPSSLERHFSSLRKFFKFLLIESKISLNPFEIKNLKLEAQHDPWHIKDFKDFLYVSNASHLTIKNYLIDIKQFITWVQAVTESNNVLGDIDSKLIEEYKQRLLEQGDFSPATINRKLSSLRKYLAWVQAKGLVSLQPSISNFQFPISNQLSNEAIEQPINQQPAERKYSAFPPFRIAQKISNAFIFALDSGLIIYLAKLVDRIEYALWKTKGQPVFAKLKTQNVKFKNLTSNFQILNPASSVQRPASVKNLPKSFYAPLEISTKFFPWYKKAWITARYSRPKWYKTYHSYPIVHYLHFAVLIIFLIAISFGFYNVFFQKGNQSPTLAASPVAPLRILSFQGRLTDNNDNPITTPTNLRFGIYTSSSATDSASTAIFPWQEVDTVSPDQDGIFNAILGNNSPIPSTLFTQNNALWLGVTVGTTPELTPRQQLATVAFATNAETLQGMVPTTSNPAAYTNTVLALDGTASSPTLTIGGLVGATFQATGGQFQILGTPLLLGTTNGSGGNVIIAPDGAGLIDLQKPLVNTTNNNNLAGAAGAVEVDDTFGILATSSATAFVLNQNGAGDLMAASASGITKFRIANTGQIIAPYYNSCTLKTDSSGNITCGSAGGAQFWQELSGALSPSNLGDDVLLGSSSTASAKFAFTGLMGTQTQASFSGQLIVMSDNGYGGNVGIGTTTPSVALDVAGAGKFSSNLTASTGNISLANTSGNTTIGNGSGTLALSSSAFNVTTGGAVSGVTTLSMNNQLSNSYANTAAINLTGNAAGITFGGSGANQIITGGTNNLALMPGGNVGVNTTSPLAPLDVRGNSSTTAVASVSGQTSFAALVANNNGVGDLFTASASGWTRFRITSAGTVLPGATNAQDIGSSSLQWNNIYANNYYLNGVPLTFGGYWQRTAGNLSPVNTNDTLAATSSAATVATFTSNNPTGTLTNNTLIQQTGGGTVTNLLNLTQSAGAVTNGITFSGTFTSLINDSTVFNISNSGAVSGASLLLNDTAGTNTTGIGTGTTTGQVTIGGGSGTAAVNTTSWKVTSAGAVSGLTDLTASGTITFSGFSNSDGVIYASSGVLYQTAAETSSSKCLVGGATAPAWASCSTAASNYWQRTAGNLSPATTNDTLAATSSAATVATFTTNNPTGTLTNNTLIQQTGAGTVTNLLNLTQSSGTVTNALSISGTFATDLISSPTLVVTNAGAASGLTGLSSSGTIIFSAFSNSGGVIYANAGALAQTAAGTSSQCLVGGASAPTWASCSAVSNNYWSLVNGYGASNGGYITPINSTADFLLGGQSTASAKFAILNLNSGTPTATIAGNLIVMPYTSGSNESGGGIQLGSTINSNNVLNTVAQGGGPSGNLYWGNTQLLDSANLGSFGASSVSNSDGTLTISPTTGAVVASLNLSHANSWSGAQTFTASTNFPSGIWNTSGNVGIGIISPLTALDVRGNSGTTAVASVSGQTSFAALVVNNNGVGDLFTASASGWTRFTVSNTGALTSAAYTGQNGILYGTQTTGVITQATTASTGLCLISGASSPTWSSCSTAASNYWQLAGNAISPNTTSYDLLIGSASTSSAAFAFTGLMGSQTQASFSGQFVVMPNNGYGGNASISGNLTIGALGTSSLQTTSDQTLTIGGNTTGNITLSPYNGSNGIINLNAPTINTNATTLALVNTTALTVNFAGAATALNMGAPTGSASLSATLVLGGTTSSTIEPGNGTLNFGYKSGANTWGTAMTIRDNTGYVGIGTTSPGATLDVSGNSGTKAFANFSGNTSFAGVTINNSGSGDLIAASASGTTEFKVDNSGDVYGRVWKDLDNTAYYMDLNTTGYSLLTAGSVGIGTTSPGAPLEISNGTQAKINLTKTGTTAGTAAIYNDGNLHITGSNGGSNNSVWIDTDSSSGSYSVHINANSTGSKTLLQEAGGNVGIGTTTPQASLDIANGTSRTNGSTALLLYGTGNGSGTAGAYSYPAEFDTQITSNIERLQIAGYKHDTTADWSGTGFRIQYGVDSSFTDGSKAYVYIGSTTSYNGLVALGTAGSDRLVVDNSGNVGIGTTGPGDGANTTGVLSVENTIWSESGHFGSNSGNGVVVIDSGPSGTSNYSIIFRTDNTLGNISGYVGQAAVYNNGRIAIRGATYITGGIDVAEIIKTQDLSVNAGDIVSQDSSSPTSAQKSQTAYSQNVLGIISTNPGVILNTGDNFETPLSQNQVKLALTGRVPLKVTSKNGVISLGDPITSSPVSGFGMKATQAGQIVARAMETFDPSTAFCQAVNSISDIQWPADDGNNPAKPCFKLPDGSYVGKIMALPENSWYDPQVYLTSSGDLSLVDQTAADTDFTVPHYFTLNDALGNPLQRVGEFSDAAIANLRVGLVNAQQVTTTALSVSTENVTIAGQSLHNYIASIVSEQLASIQNLTSNNVVSPIASTDEIHTNFVSPVDDTAQIGLKLDNNKLSVLSGNSASSSAIATIDNSGNASFSGQLTSNSLNTNDATVSGTLHVGKIIADEIVGATPSATYVTNVTNIYNSSPSASNSDFGLIADAATVGTASAVGSEQSAANGYIDISSYSGQLTYVPNLGADNAVFGQNLTVFGETSLSDTSIVGQLSVNGSLILADNSINVLGSDLNLQPLRQGGLSIMGGLVYIDTDGNLKVGGNAEFAKNVTVNGTLATNVISPLPGNDLNVNTGNSNLQITNASDSAILSVNNLGDLVASGAGTFSKLNLGLVQPALAVSQTEVVATGSAGTANIAPYQTQVTIDDPVVTDKSLIYITPTSSTNNQVLYLLKQVPDESFTVGLQNPSIAPIPFNWIIVN
ncbi:MAG: site-specific integrase [Candidatus Levyibacteriota bacterium]